jgi:magnesium chelatase accessory protein
VAGAADRAIPPEQSARVRGLVPSAMVEILPGLGHLAHEERPDLIAGLIARVASADAP